MAIRFIDAGTVSAARSQALYHGLAYAHTASTPDTVVLAVPGEPYVCVGFHQDVDREVDTAYCREHGLPVLRRKTGGGAVYLDSGQLFVQWIMAPGSLPLRNERRFELFAGPIVAAHRALGVPAELRPPNDVHVNGRKIVGTGAARIGAAEVLVGNFIFDFDAEVMARVARAPSAAYRSLARRSLELYMTTLRRELGHAPERDRVAALYRDKCAEVLSADLVEGALTPDELRSIEAMERRLGADEFVRQSGGMRRPGLKIHEDVWVVEARRGAASATARLRSGRIEEVALRGSAPNGAWTELERALVGVELRRGPVTRAVNGLSPRDGRSGPGRADWIETILALKTRPGGHDS